MNKITGIQSDSHVTCRQTIQKADGDLFQNTLDKALEEKKIPETDKPPTSTLGEIRSESIIPIECRIQSSSHTVVEKTDSLMGLLDQYAANLSDPEKSLKEIASLLATIKTSAQELMQEARQTLNPDDELKQIARQCAIMANVEYIKFERGDYL